MRIIERHILLSIFKTFSAIMLIFIFLYVLIDTASNLDDFIRHQVPLMILMRYYLSLLPIILSHTMPTACLIACLIVFSSANAHNEIIVLRAGGLNFWKITRPAIFFGILVSLMMFGINEYFVPVAFTSSESIKSDQVAFALDDKRKEEEIKNLTFYGLDNRLFFIDSFFVHDSSLRGITIIGHDKNQEIKEKIVALKGEWTGIVWKFHRCQITTLQEPGNHFTEETRYYNEKLMDIRETPDDFLKQRLNVEAMNIKQLQAYIQRFQGSGAARALNNLKVDLHQKIAFPFGNLVVLLVGLPLALLSGRRKALTFMSLGIAVGISFIFYVLNAIGLAFGKGGFLPPFVSAWVAPILFLSLAVYLIKKNF